MPAPFPQQAIDNGTFTTPGGTEYDDVEIAPPGTSTYDRLYFRALIRTDHVAKSPQPVVVLLHGAGGGSDEDTALSNTSLQPMYREWLDLGWTVISPRGKPNGWGSPASTTSLDEVWNWLETHLDASVPLTYGLSMGGLVGMNWSRFGAAPVAGVVINSSPTNIWHIHFIAGHTGAGAAFGYTLGSTWNHDLWTSKVGPYDPVGIRMDPVNFPTGPTTGGDLSTDETFDLTDRVRFYHGYEDTSVDRDYHTDLLSPKLLGFGVPEAGITGSGGHTATGTYLRDDCRQFYLRCLGDTPPPPPPPPEEAPWMTVRLNGMTREIDSIRLNGIERSVMAIRINGVSTGAP